MATMSPALLALVKGAKNKYSGGFANIVKIKEGKTVIRILAKPGEQFWADSGIHWIKTEKNGKPVAVVGCHDVVKSQPCAVCTAVEKAGKAATDDAEIAIIKEWKARKSILVAALVRSGPKASEDPQIVEFTPTTFGKILSMIETYAADDVDILDAATGSDFVIERVGSGINDTEYTPMVAPKSKPVPAGVLERMPDLAAVIEKEFFRGEDRKALTAIVNMTGVSLSLPSPGSRAMLTGPSAAVDDASIEEAVVTELDAETEAPFEPGTTTIAPGSGAELAAAKTGAAVATTVSKPAATTAAKPTASAALPKTPAAPATAPKKDEFNDDLGAADIDAMLAEIDGIGA